MNNSGRAWYVVGVLMLAYTLSFIDRQILSLLVQPIKAELAVSDTQIGLLQGLAFALFYTVLGLPMGWVVDRFSRRNLIVAGVALWSVMTAVCGVARGFSALFLARVGVGVGEATLSPAALSMISDSFPRERLATAISVYSMGVFVGSGLAFLVGGLVITAVSHHSPVAIPLLGPIAPWRLTFIVVGALGLGAVVLVATLQEPSRTSVLLGVDERPAALTIRQSLHEIRLRWRPIAAIAAGMACHAICMYGLFAWLPTFFVRRYAWTAGEAGPALGLIVLVFGCAGMYAGGRLCDRWYGRGIYFAPLRVGVVGMVVAGIALVTSVMLRQPLLSLALVVPAMFGLAAPIGSLFAALQMILPNQVRGQVSALYLFTISLVGISLGPLLPALLSDHVFQDPARIGDALSITVAVASLCAALVFRWSYPLLEARPGP
ncbi:MAG: MFS transporter [Proteobacteria bacterium]|nr:MFS transporter [Pseudomonadota bacterium]